jgi:Tfp pilus assembly protein PilW
MKKEREQGFTVVEMLISATVLLVFMSVALGFFARSQSVYNNERATLNMVQDERVVFDRLTNEIRLAGAGLPAYHAIISGNANTLVVRGDFKNTSTIIASPPPGLSSNDPAIFAVGDVSGFAVGQTLALHNTSGQTAGSSGLATVSAIDPTNHKISVDSSSFLSLTSGAKLSDYTPGSIVNVIERRTYSIITAGIGKGSVTRTVAYENTKNTGQLIQPKETLVTNLLDGDGNIGLRFAYYKADGALAEMDASGNVVAGQVARVQVSLNARTSHRDVVTGKYRTFNVTSHIQVRGQYGSSAGF